MKVRHLNCATMEPLGGAWAVGLAPPGEAPRMVAHCLLIETPSDGLVLVDSGFGLADIAEPGRRIGRALRLLARPRLAESETAIRQVQALGYRSSDVRHVVLTHLDVDHAGGLSDFPDATVHIYRPELEAALNARGLDKQRYRAAQWDHGPTWRPYDVSGERWKGFECVRRLTGLPPEILLVPVTGHSRGHAAVAVGTADGWLLHCGDAYFHYGEMENHPRCPRMLSLFQEIVQVDKQDRLANQDRLRELAQSARIGDERVRVFSAHCAHELLELRGAGQ